MEKALQNTGCDTTEEVKGNTPTYKKKGMEKSKLVFLLISIIPALVLYLFFVVYPVINMFYLSFTELPDLMQDPKWMWFQNYSNLMNDQIFWKSFLNTFIMVITVTVVTFILAMFFGNLLSKKRVKGRAFFRIVFYIPNILSVVVIAAIFNAVYRNPGGMLVGIFGSGYKSPLTSENTALMGVIIAMIWQAFGYYMVMYIAAMDGIPDELYESAGLDGAGRTRQFFIVTIPLIWEVLRVTLTFFIVGTIGISFMFVDSMIGTSGPMVESSHVLLTYMQKMTNSRAYGYAMAIGVILFIFSYALSLILNFATKREVVQY